jgi:hypothetical protein
MLIANDFNKIYFDCAKKILVLLEVKKEKASAKP